MGLQRFQAGASPTHEPPPLAPPSRKTWRDGDERRHAGCVLPFVVGGENPSARRVVAVFRLADAGRASLLVVESGAGGHDWMFRVYLHSAAAEIQSGGQRNRRSLKAHRHTARVSGMLSKHRSEGGGRWHRMTSTNVILEPGSGWLVVDLLILSVRFIIYSSQAVFGEKNQSIFKNCT